MKKKSIVFIGYFILCNMLCHVLSQNRNQENPFNEQIPLYPQEKLHISTDKDDYIAGDTIWLRAHCVDAALHHPVCVSRYVYVELRNPKGELSRRIKLLARDSVYCGYFPTQQVNDFGEYSLTAYTLYMRDPGPDFFFKKPITISAYRENHRIPESRIPQRKIRNFDVSFFPEGGYLIDGYNCCVAFKALADDGISVEARGVLKNNKGKVIDTLRTLHAGLGCFDFTPHTGERYWAEFTISTGQSKRFELPATVNTACVLKVLETDENFTVMVQSGRPLPEGLRLIVHCRGNICYRKSWNYKFPALIFKREDLLGGVLQILLLDKAGNALSERLFFNQGKEKARTTVHADRRLGYREKIALSIQVTTPDNAPATGNFSIAVTDRNTVPAPISGSIFATLLLTSELRGNIETPDWYFITDNNLCRTALDALLMTQGWRRYDVPAVMQGKYDEPNFPLEIGQEITGTIHKGSLWNRKKKLDRYKLRMIVPKRHFATQTSIDKEGHFSLNGFDFPDSTLYVLRTSTSKGSSVSNTFVKVAQDSFPDVGNLPHYISRKENVSHLLQARNFIEKRGQTDIRNILIDTIFVIHHKHEDAKSAHQRLAARKWDDRQIKESGAGTIVDFIARIPGMNVTGSQVWYHGKVPAFMVDGQIEETVSMLENPGQDIGYFDNSPMEDNNSGSGQVVSLTDDYKSMPSCLSYPLSFVKYIEIIDGANTVLWGPGITKNGIISITLKSGNELNEAVANEPSVNIGLISPLGYQTPAEFYAPAYETEQKRRTNTPDFRTTLYWNPAVKLDEEGRATVEFYTADAPPDYDIKIEGVTRNGKIICKSEHISNM